MSKQKNDPPLDTLRDGSVNIKLWRKESQRGPFPTASIGNTYKDPESGEFKDSRSFSDTDLLKLEKMLPEAHKEMTLWKEHFRAQEREAQHSNVEAEPQTMAQKRDAAFAKAKSQNRNVKHERKREREPR